MITAATTVVITTTRAAISINGGPVGIGIGLGSIDLFGDLLEVLPREVTEIRSFLPPAFVRVGVLFRFLPTLPNLLELGFSCSLDSTFMSTGANNLAIAGEHMIRVAAPKTIIAPAPLRSTFAAVVLFHSIFGLARVAPGGRNGTSDTQDKTFHTFELEFACGCMAEKDGQGVPLTKRVTGMLVMPIRVGGFHLLSQVGMKAFHELSCAVDWPYFLEHECADCTPEADIVVVHA